MTMTATRALLRVLLLLLAFGHHAHGAECFPPCNRHYGVCTEDNVCRCHPGWQGPQCNECMPFPGCVHGFCDEPWQCTCNEGWDGHYCDIDMRACTSNPCANNGTCTTMQKGHYQCTCAPGFSGENCQKKDGPCEVNGSPCQHGGSCVDDDGQASYASCVCPPGFSGNFCEIVVSVCTSNPCENQGTCTDIGGDFRCRCPPGFVDKTCSRAVTTCASEPCLNGGTCLQHSQAICFTILGVLTGLVVLGTVCVVFLNKCEAWIANLRYNRMLNKKKKLLLRYSSREDMAVNIIFPDKIDMTTFKEASDEEI
ncbi:protein delta homolog 1 isoform X4 [Pipistrellus kuhlii]|uniref:Protein delta homolog 1 n=1 Tax=Pipistrellus kuhlii TaxID=59472 RepID=A0A7J7SFU2_PIPKU|nr:protein delta homolog 1 isoform X4 [Pipistrellus kuhlii]KAF6287228.1 delta like non-canonical Notch ligand 1 [Pipistrellus kuhlii]